MSKKRPALKGPGHRGCWKLSDEQGAEIARLRAEVERLKQERDALSGQPRLGPAGLAYLKGLFESRWKASFVRAEAVVRAAEPALKELRVAQAWVVNKSHKDQIEPVASELERCLAASRERA